MDWVGLLPNDWYPHMRRKVRKETTGRMPCNDRGGDWECCIYKAKECQGLPATTETRKRQGKIALYSFQRDMALPIP